MHYADGWEFVTDAVAAGTRYDVILVDLPDEHVGDAQHNRLYGKDFLALCRSALRDGGVVGYQAGCPTVWRNTTLVRSWQRFRDVFPTCVYFGSDEHEWAFLFGQEHPCDDPVARMVDRLEGCRYRPESIDADTVRGCTVPPHSVHPRALGRAGGPAAKVPRGT